MPKLRLPAAACGGLLLLALGCATTKLAQTWSDPTITSPVQFKKVLVLYINPDSYQRRAAEDALFMNVRSTEVIQGYRVLPDELMKDVEGAKAFIQKTGIDGAILMRLVEVDKETSWVPGSTYGPYSSFYGYWGYAWPTVYDPGYMRTDTYVKLETMVYRVADGKLIYAAQSSTMNPESVRQIADDLAIELREDLKQRGLIR